MFKVRHKVSNSIHEVYDIQYDDCGYPHFLIYENNAWVRVSAKHYIPYDLGCRGVINKKILNEVVDK